MHDHVEQASFLQQSVISKKTNKSDSVQGKNLNKRKIYFIGLHWWKTKKKLGQLQSSVAHKNKLVE